MEKANDLEKEVDSVKKRITDLMLKIQEYKEFHPEYKQDQIYKSMAADVTRQQKQLVELKQTRKITNSAMRQLKYKLFKELVIERIGPEETEKLEQEAKERMKAYQYNLATKTFRKKNEAHTD